MPRSRPSRSTGSAASVTAARSRTHPGSRPRPVAAHAPESVDACPRPHREEARPRRRRHGPKRASTVFRTGRPRRPARTRSTGRSPPPVEDPARARAASERQRPPGRGRRSARARCQASRPARRPERDRNMRPTRPPRLRPTRHTARKRRRHRIPAARHTTTRSAIQSRIPTRPRRDWPHPPRTRRRPSQDRIPRRCRRPRPRSAGSAAARRDTGAAGGHEPHPPSHETRHPNSSPPPGPRSRAAVPRRSPDRKDGRRQSLGQAGFLRIRLDPRTPPRLSRRRACPCRLARTFAKGVVPVAHSLLPSFRYPCCARPATPARRRGHPRRLAPRKRGRIGSAQPIETA